MPTPSPIIVPRIGATVPTVTPVAMIVRISVAIVTPVSATDQREQRGDDGAEHEQQDDHRREEPDLVGVVLRRGLLLDEVDDRPAVGDGRARAARAGAVARSRRSIVSSEMSRELRPCR